MGQAIGKLLLDTLGPSCMHPIIGMPLTRNPHVIGQRKIAVHQLDPMMLKAFDIIRHNLFGAVEHHGQKSGSVFFGQLFHLHD